MMRVAFVLAVAGLAFAGAPAGALAETSDDATASAPSGESKPPEVLETRPAENPTESKPPDSGEGRYTFSRVQDGYIRLDNRTGQVSLCSKRAVGWGCQLVPEDRGAFEGEIARLQDENAVLKKDLLTRGLALPGNVKADPDLAQRDPAFKMPSEAQLERMRSIIESAWRRLVEMIGNLQRDMLKKS
jgi:hypothetical protein